MPAHQQSAGRRGQLAAPPDVGNLRFSREDILDGLEGDDVGWIGLDRLSVVGHGLHWIVEQVAVDLREVLSGEPGRDLLLAPRDRITVYSIWSLR